MMLCLKLTLLTLLIAAPGLLVSGETVITCDGDVQRLTCDTGVIKVKSTVYGRSDSTICSTKRPHLTVTDTSCYSTISTIADRCNGLRECEVKTDLLGSSDPCKGTYKYYTTTYGCIDAREAVVCEHGYRTLDCGTDTIEILNANFGRADSVTCSSGLPNGFTQNTNCYAPNTLSIVSSLCNGMNTCTVEASSTVFSDPCKTTAKYLTVSYTCIAGQPNPCPVPPCD
ncbi:rhamnose-binding lectin-like [Hemibagrus wyckioides]|uniref:rhamnose-binding lectin-like n=1 Tax=Hemibagrus wyckioides TaxID=337641 RepID=UPI00266DC3E5|nr:rhamnose-binding lectin-like [Hemibagrus wyckioides]XP_058241484.1 rhamnose-binding lectin-like [Hemibagrus wyckioides]XP_058241485.1 rhamnose-binding lectin-like [Hemibagrus wyckioides]